MGNLNNLKLVRPLNILTILEGESNGLVTSNYWPGYQIFRTLVKILLNRHPLALVDALFLIAIMGSTSQVLFSPKIKLLGSSAFASFADFSFNL